MTPDSVDADLREAIEHRLAECLDAARRRREKTEQDRATKLARRTAGLRQRHRRILARRNPQDQDDENEAVQRAEMASSTAGGSQSQDDETPADGNVRSHARPGTALAREAVQRRKGNGDGRPDR